jgi:hypothetical protein
MTRCYYPNVSDFGSFWVSLPPFRTTRFVWNFPLHRLAVFQIAVCLTSWSKLYVSMLDFFDLTSTTTTHIVLVRGTRIETLGKIVPYANRYSHQKTQRRSTKECFQVACRQENLETVHLTDCRILGIWSTRANVRIPTTIAPTSLQTLLPSKKLSNYTTNWKSLVRLVCIQAWPCVRDFLCILQNWLQKSPSIGDSCGLVRQDGSSLESIDIIWAKILCAVL